jgi:hypothetical protein
MADLSYAKTHEPISFAEDRRWVCDGCDRWTPMEIWVDSRDLEKTQIPGKGTMITEGHLPAEADPPRRPRLYVCPKCHHAHEGQPSLRNPT